MHKNRGWLVFVWLFLLALLAGCNFTLAEDVTPPPGWKPTPVPPTPAVDRLYPLTPPDAQAGAKIYQTYCADCHGPEGKGDGPLMEQLPKPPRDFTDAEAAAEDSPADWFLAITQGRMDALMPSFAEMAEGMRWDVLAYIVSLRHSDAQRSKGEELFAARCAACHSDTSQAGPLTWKSTAGLSDAQLAALITQGHKKMPPIAGLSQEELTALTAYLRTLGTAQAAAAQESTATPQPSPETAQRTAQPTETASTPEVQEGYVTIKGTVTNGSGGEVPAGLKVTLYGVDNQTNDIVLQEETVTDENGQFVFEHIEAPFHRLFLVGVEYNGATYGSDWAVAAGTPELELPVTIYESTTDTSHLRADRVHIFFEFPTEETIRVIELYVISNDGDKTVIPAGPGQPVVKFSLPEGAAHLQFQDGALGQRYVEIEGGFGDTHPVPPGQGAHQVVFAYELPYHKKVEVRHAVHLPVDSVALLAPTTGSLKVRSEMLSDSGVQTIEGQTIHVYESHALQPGDEIVFQVSGNPRGSAAPEITSRTGLAIGLAAFGLGLIVVGVVLWRRQQALEAEVAEETEEEAPEGEAEPIEDNPETLMDAILALDDLYQQGRLSEAAYQARRAELKARLAQRLQKTSAADDAPTDGNQEAA